MEGGSELGYLGLKFDDGVLVWNWDEFQEEDLSGEAGAGAGGDERVQSGGMGEGKTGVRGGCGAIACAAITEQAGAVKLFPAVGQIDGYGGQGGISGDRKSVAYGKKVTS